MTITEQQPTTRVEWAAELTWPDGHVEYRTKSRMTGEPYQRRDAELKAADENDRDFRHDGMPAVTARVVSRLVTVTAWTPVAGSVPLDVVA